MSTSVLRMRWLGGLWLLVHGGITPAQCAGDDVVRTPIFNIQGAGHRSPLAGETVATSGIVTAITDDGFFLQDDRGDGDDLTSDAIYVYTGSKPATNVRDQVEVSGEVIEFTAGGERSGNLSLSEIALPERVTVVSTENQLPQSVFIGKSGRRPPTKIIDNDELSVFDPDEDGIDFYESLEAMRITVEDAAAVNPTNRFGEIFVVSDQGRLATGMNSRGGITATKGDLNPERIQIDDRLLVGVMPTVSTGDLLGDVTGVMGYSHGNFEVLADAVSLVTPSGLAPEVTVLTGDETHLTVASYNVQNLDPRDPPEKFQRLAEHIAWNLQSPDIVALQEVQDNSGTKSDGETSADLTASLLTSAILAAGGPAYDYYDLAPIDNSSGGEPGGNIRVAYLVDSSRATLVPGSLLSLGKSALSAFGRSRNPLEATFLFNDQEVVLINCHLSSKAGSSPLFGSIQPPSISGGQKRESQATFLRNHVSELLHRDPPACVVVLGDLNDTEFSEPLQILTAAPPLLLNLNVSLSATERHSYGYQGNAQMIDHILVSAKGPGSALDAVHVNTGFTDKFSDHDPLIARVAVVQTRVARDHSSIHSTWLNLSQNAPNPFTTSTSISYLLPYSGFVQLRIFNATGQLVRTLVNDHLRSGRHQWNWDAMDQRGRQVSNGIYSVQLRALQTTWSRRMVLMR